MFIYLPVSSPLCCLLGNVCHSALPPLARPTLGRTQPSPDAKPLLPFHLLPGFTDVSTVTHRGFHGNHAPQLLTLSRCIFCSKWRSLFQGVVCLSRVIFQYTDAWASCPHLSKYTTSDAESCDISTPPGGWSWFLGIPHTAFLRAVCPGVCEGWRWRELAESKPRGE